MLEQIHRSHRLCQVCLGTVVEDEHISCLSVLLRVIFVLGTRSCLSMMIFQ